MRSASRLAAATAFLAAMMAGCGDGRDPSARQAPTPPSTTASPTIPATASPAPLAPVTPTPTRTATPTATPTPRPPLTAEEYLARRRETGTAIGAALQRLLSAQGGPGDPGWRDAQRVGVAELRQRTAEARALQPPACLAAGRQLDLQAFAVLDGATDVLLRGIMREETGASDEARRLFDEAATALRAALAPLRTADVAYDTARC